MLYYFLRHADAEPVADSDRGRQLTAKGLDQADKVGKFCSRNGLLPDIVLASPYTRALQTARIVAAKLGGVQLLECDWLGCGMTAEVCRAELAGLTRFSQVLLVGHEPDFSSTIGALIGSGTTAALHIRKSSFTCVAADQPRTGCGVLEFSIPVRLM